MAATVIALGSMRRLTTGVLTRGLIMSNSANTVSPASARCPVRDQNVGAGRQVGVEPRAVTDQAVGVADLELVADLDVADDAPRDQAGDLHGDHLDTVGRADQHAVALVVLAGGLQLGGVEQTRPVLHGHDLAADRCALHVGVQHRKEDADTRQRRGGQAELGGRRRLLDEADQPVGRCDDETGPGGRHPGRMPEERGVGGGRRETRAPQPGIPATDGGDRQAHADERQARGVHRRYGGPHQRREPRGA